MARKTLYIPDQLLERLEASGTDIAESLSREFQEYLKNRLAWAENPRSLKPAESEAILRHLTANDVDAVVEMWDDVEDGWHLTEMARRRVMDNLRRTVDHAEAFCIVADLDGQVVGFVTGSRSGHPVMPGHAGEIEELHVRRTYRRRKIGSDLIRSAIRNLDSMGVTTIRLSYPNDQANRLKPFYERLGFDCDHTIAHIWPQVGA
ncbi:MAG: GNAT family N-acetyltransferase [Proteobacteria bacterium]|jgi:ribosomal protein S18 acetylase RimI-like enzyme|nr:GNAT family N-acetyltransferase [Pseudomonadota bacterium]MDA1298777.1 GNAT family N-acetyltransferase [Pseudomonadota bacterium]